MEYQYLLRQTLEQTQTLFHLSDDILHLYQDKKADPELSLLGRCIAHRLAHGVDIETFLAKSLLDHSIKVGQKFWSMAHKNDFVVSAISDNPIGVDLEMNEKKSEMLFDHFTNKEWAVLNKKTWQNFYQAWTAKEATIKLLGLTLADMPKINIVLRLDNGLQLQYQDKTILCKIEQTNQMTLAFAAQNTDS